MAKKITPSLFFLFPAAYGAVLAHAAAEFHCTSEITYAWERQKKADGPEASPVAESTPTAESGVNETLVHFGRVGAEGNDEAASKQHLEEEMARAKGRASEACRRDHENLSTCAATKLKVLGSVLSSLGFSARRELELAITSDCQAQSGRCTKVAASEPKCIEVVTAAATPTAAAGADKKKK